MKTIEGKIRKALKEYNMIQANDNIAVGLSGGKDSITLLTALAHLQKYYNIPFNLTAISIDMFDGQTDYSKLTKYVNDLGLKHHIIPSKIAQILFEERKENNPCSLCAKLRRGLVNNTAKSLGCNKVALGHHADDLIETFFLSLFYESRLSTFSPVTYLDRTQLTVIRPMILVKESEIIKESKNLPIIKNKCPADKHTKREFIKTLLKNINNDIPRLNEKVLSALINPSRYHLFDDYYSKAD